jgi:glycosyltransferase involved in cell wall biosynthesis
VNSTLSIAIPTYKRADLLAETLNAFLPQIEPHNIPVCISYTDDTGRTERVIQKFRNRYPLVNAITDPCATNIDKKIVSVVKLVQTPYLWLFGDDDLPEPGAIDRVLKILCERDWGLIVLNASSYNSNLSVLNEERVNDIHEDRIYKPGEHESLLRDTAGYATFLGGLVFDKTMWDSKDPTDYLDTDYVHVAVLYRSIVGRYARFVADPQLRLRLGSMTWKNRYFEVELINWPKTIWELPDSLYSDASKASICEKSPTTSLSRLMATRAYGHYGIEQYRKFVLCDPKISTWKKLILRTPLLFPQPWAGAALIAFRYIQSLCGNPKMSIQRTLYLVRN